MPAVIAKEVGLAKSEVLPAVKKLRDRLAWEIAAGIGTVFAGLTASALVFSTAAAWFGLVVGVIYAAPVAVISFTDVARFSAWKRHVDEKSELVTSSVKSAAGTSGIHIRDVVVRRSGPHAEMSIGQSRNGTTYLYIRTSFDLSDTELVDVLVRHEVGHLVVGGRRRHFFFETLAPILVPLSFVGQLLVDGLAALTLPALALMAVWTASWSLFIRRARRNTELVCDEFAVASGGSATSLRDYLQAAHSITGPRFFMPIRNFYRTHPTDWERARRLSVA